MIYDCFSYWDEDILLDLRLNVLDKFVDYFVIVEGNKTWQNNHKKLRFDITKFESVDQIVSKEIETIESDAYDKSVLLRIFRDLNNDTD